jgi:hypothetical protein
LWSQIAKVNFSNQIHKLRIIIMTIIKGLVNLKIIIRLQKKKITKILINLQMNIIGRIKIMV